MNITQSPSPNYGPRYLYKPELIVIHCTDGYFPSDLQYLRNPNPGGAVGPVSTHFLVAPDGMVHQLVAAENAAWHAGRVNNPTAKLLRPGVNPNWYSIGIETSMVGTNQPTAAQVSSLKELLLSLNKDLAIPLDRDHVIGHREIYSLKTCPGTIVIEDLLPKSDPADSPTMENLKKQISTLQQIILLLKKLLGLK